MGTLESQCHVSLVIPAYNASSTLGETLGCVERQTFRHWEAIVVDDASTDDTAAIAMGYVEKDRRFRLIRQDHRGQPATRNTGIASTHGEWLVFLDSDDWVASKFLDLMMRRSAAEPALDAIVCGCARVSASGTHAPPAIYDPTELTFPAFAVDCPIAIHSCVVRRAVAEAVGGFDSSLRACSDWDFWQRVTRTGARFGTIPEVLAFYRSRPGSDSTKADFTLVDGWKVIRRGHARDPRVPAPDPRYAEGLPVAGLPEALFRQAIWAASLMLVRGKDARELFPLMGDQRAPSLAPETVALWVFRCIPNACAQGTEAWHTLWPGIAERLMPYLEGLEQQSGTLDLAKHCRLALENMLRQLGINV
jgi:hypothetical protein